MCRSIMVNVRDNIADVIITPANIEDAKRIFLYYKEILEEKLPFISNNSVPTIEQEIEFIQNHNTDYSLIFRGWCSREKTSV